MNRTDINGFDLKAILHRMLLTPLLTLPFLLLLLFHRTRKFQLVSFAEIRFVQHLNEMMARIDQDIVLVRSAVERLAWRLERR